MLACYVRPLTLLTATSDRLPQKRSEVINKTVSQAGFRGIPGLYVLALDREDGTHIDNVGFTDLLQAGDTIWFAAELASIPFLSRFPGLEMVQQQQVDKSGVNILYRTLIQVSAIDRCRRRPQLLSESIVPPVGGGSCEVPSQPLSPRGRKGLQCASFQSRESARGGSAQMQRN